MKHVAVIDIGKTNAKLALVEDGSLQEIAVVTRPNTVLAGPPYPHFDLEGHWDFLIRNLAAFHAQHGVDAISVATHGASAVLLDAKGALAAPMLDYEHGGPDDLAQDYDAIRPAFAQTGSARLPHGLNLGAQLHWLLETQAGLSDRLAHVLTYPQYWGWRLTGQMACDVCSLGCHTDLWDPWRAQFSDLVDRLGIAGKIAPPQRPDAVLGRLLPDLAAVTGLSPDTPVTVGIHDSNASLYPHVLGRDGAFSVVSTGTWVVAMAVGGETPALDPTRDVLVNVNALGAPVPSARFMGGREFEVIRAGSTAQPDDTDRRMVLDRDITLLPAVEPGSGPFPTHQMRWTVEPASEGARLVALSWYLAMMTHTCLGLIGARGPVIVEGPFARNPDYLDMLSSLWPEGIEITTSATGTSVGAALLSLGAVAAPATRAARRPDHAPALIAYAKRWQQRN